MMMGNDYLNYNYQYVSGFANDLNLESVTTIGYDDFFYKILNISRLFFRLGGEGNLGFRLRLGISTNKDSPFVPFVLDNYINVRGSGNRVSRGTAEMTINSEYRHTLYDQYLHSIAQTTALSLIGKLHYIPWQVDGRHNYSRRFLENSLSFAPRAPRNQARAISWQPH